MKPYQTENQTCRLSRSEILARQTLANIDANPELIRQAVLSNPKCAYPDPNAKPFVRKDDLTRRIVTEQKQARKRKHIEDTYLFFKEFRAYICTRNLSCSAFIRLHGIPMVFKRAYSRQQLTLDYKIIDMVKSIMRT